MNGLTANLRKAAILIRSLDADTAASVLARLSREEADAVRIAIQSLGDWDNEEQADVTAEFRRVGPIAGEDPRRGVELSFSAAATAGRGMTEPIEPRPPVRPFEFLEQARVEALVPYLSREHGQTVAVVLTYLPPRRAAEVLAALPARLQVEAVERMSALGETDPNSLQVLEQELADWVKRQKSTHALNAPRPDVVAAMLAAADESVRSAILKNVMQHNHALARQIAPAAAEPTKPASGRKPPIATSAKETTSTTTHQPPDRAAGQMSGGNVRESPTIAAATAPHPQIQINDLARMEKSVLTAVMRGVDAELMVLALAGASDELVDRIAGQMPRSAARAFRRRLSQIGPTRLRDVEAAQQEVAKVASSIIHARRSGTYTMAAAPAARGK